MKPLRIALVAPPWFAVPPSGYGGIERVVALLADGLAARGHDVTLFASGGSKTRARLVSVFDEPPSPLLGNAYLEMQHLTAAYANWRDFDLIHDHTVLGLLAGAAISVPVVHTIHGQVIEPFRTLYARLAHEVRLVAISHHQRSTLPAGCPADVIHNALDPAEYPYSPGPGRHLLFVGRMSPEKGVLHALEIARRTRLPLLLLAKINEPMEHEYFEQVVRPAFAGVDVEFVEQAPHEVKARAYREALVTLFPIQWPEPFGLVMIESMAAGTPVIAFRNGSVPEVVADGQTGFVCDDVEQAVEAVSRVGTIDRAACRAHIEQHFSAQTAIEAHEALYQAEIERSRPVPAYAVAPSLPAARLPAPAAAEPGPAPAALPLPALQ